MDKPVRAPGYDLFKLIVAIALLILFLLLARRQSPQSPIPEATHLPPTGTAYITPSIAVSITSAQVSATAVLLFSPTPITTLLPTSSPTAIGEISRTPTPTPSPTETAVIEATTTSAVGIPSTADACQVATSRSHLQVGSSAIILRPLNFRSSPGIHNNWLLTNKPGTKVEVIDGPVCLPYFVGAYVWWQIKLPDGRIGWSAEGSLRSSFYFMEPGP